MVSYTLSQQSKTLIIILSIAVVVIIIASILAIFLLKHNNKNVHQARLDNMVKRLDSQNSTLVSNYLSRLRNVANQNEEYIPIYTQISASYSKLSNEDRDNLLSRYENLTRRVAQEKITKELVDQIKILETAINQHNKDIERIEKDLNNIFQPGDEIRVRLTDLQAKYAQINEDIDRYYSSLGICISQIKDYLMEVDMKFEMLSDKLDSAKYGEAQDSINKIEEAVYNLYGKIETIAQYCNMINDVIPQQLNDLVNKNNEMDRNGYVVSYAKVSEVVDNTKKLLAGCVVDFQHLCFSNFEDICLEITKKISQSHALLEKERMAKENLDSKYLVIKDKIKQAEEDFIKTKRQFTSLKGYYVFPKEITDKFMAFEINSTTLNSIKVEYEGYLFVKAKNPASYMLEKLDKMEEICNLVLDDINYFNNYFKDVFEYVESTYENINTLTVQLSSTLGNLRKNKCHSLYEKYNLQAYDTLRKLNEMNKVVTSKPIDLQYLYSNYAKLASMAKNIAERINVEYNYYEMVEKCILYVNPLRTQFADVNNRAKDIEMMFINGDYEDAFNAIDAILSEYHPAAFVANKEN